ncbi:hypothetical protein MTP99_000509 [Tenebrio molitor]|nr:hypothetical protein MTP99_000509 [Tenebrio molitor]
MFGYIFIVLTISVFYITVELQASFTNWFMTTYSILTCSSYAVDSFYVCHFCYSTVVEASRAGQLIHKIKTDNHDIIDEIEMFSLQIANARVEFTAADFFAINYALLVSIIGAVLSYIIILIQVADAIKD